MYAHTYLCLYNIYVILLYHVHIMLYCSWMHINFILLSMLHYTKVEELTLILWYTCLYYTVALGLWLLTFDKVHSCIITRSLWAAKGDKVWQWRSMKFTLPARYHHNLNSLLNIFHIRKVYSFYLKLYMDFMWWQKKSSCTTKPTQELQGLPSKSAHPKGLSLPELLTACYQGVFVSGSIISILT